MKRLYIRKITVLPTTRTLVLKSYWIWKTINREKSIVESLDVEKFCWFGLDVKCMCKKNVQIYYWKDDFIYLRNVRRIIITWVSIINHIVFWFWRSITVVCLKNILFAFRIGNLQKDRKRHFLHLVWIKVTPVLYGGHLSRSLIVIYHS